MYGSIAIVCVLILRLLFRKTPKKVSILLWIIVAVRLLCPLNIGSRFGIMNLFENHADTAIVLSETASPEEVMPAENPGNEEKISAEDTNISYSISSEAGTTKETDRLINVLGMTPDQLDLQGGYVRYCTSHNINEDTTEEKSQLYYDADGNMVLECLYNDDSVLIYSDYFIYDDDGRVVREELWDTGTYSLGLYRTYTYGPNGVERQESGKFKKDPDHYHVYEYDNQGRLVLDTEYSYEYDKSYWYCEYVYENDGTYTTHVTSFDVLKQDMVMSKDYKQYSADGTLLLTQTGVRSQSEVYNYDKNGVLQTVDMYYGKTLHQTTTYEYDNQGRLVRDYTAFPKSDAYRENIYTYKDL